MFTLGTTLGAIGRGRMAKPQLLSMPAGFRWTPSFNVYEQKRIYTTDFNFDAIKPAGTEMWVSKTGNDTTGTGSAAAPYATLAKAYTMGASIVQVRTGIYNRTDGFAANFNPVRSMAVIAADGPGSVILTRHQTGLTWAQQASLNTNVYSTTRSTVRTVIDLTAPGRSGELLKDGATPVPIPLSVQTSVAGCQSTPGSWYQSGSTLYVSTHDGRAPDANILVLLIENIWAPTNDVTVWLDGIEGWGDSAARMVMAGANTAVWAWRNSASRFGGSLANGGSWDGCDFVYSVGCDITDIFSAVDGFNYHASASANPRLKALEYNCVSLRCGQSGQATNNASTAHDNCSILRLNGRYESSYGPAIADTLGAHSVNLGCLSGNVLISTAYQNAAYQVGTSSTLDSTTSKLWSKNCTAVGGQYARVQATGGDFFDMGGFTDNTTLHDHGTIVSI